LDGGGGVRAGWQGGGDGIGIAVDLAQAFAGRDVVQPIRIVRSMQKNTLTMALISGGPRSLWGSTRGGSMLPRW
jgi:hypothetical protein